LSAKTTRDFMEAVGELMTATLPKIETPRLSKCCCEIPETECPPRCVCDICWKACPGGVVQADIRVTNTGSATREFTFDFTPFSGPGNPAAKVHVSPSSASLAPHASANVAVAFTVPNDFQHGRRYTAELRVYGVYEQCVRMTLDVEPPTGKDCCAAEHCEVRADDLPTRIRAHHWYDHFQCTEPCVEVRPCPPDEPHRTERPQRP
jgi:hypothetical protein